MIDLAKQLRDELEVKQSTWVELVKQFSTTEDKGIGDTVHRYLAMFGAERFKQWAKDNGIPCGCTERQAEWNERWPYE